MRACTPPIMGELEVLFFSNWEERGGENNVDSKVEEIVIKNFFPKQYVVEDDREQLVPDDESSGARRRSFSDRKEQKQGLRGQQEGASYGSERISFNLKWYSVDSRMNSRSFYR